MTAQGDATRQRLLDATSAVVREVGYARATTRGIADAAGMAEGTIYRHFADKRELFFAAVLSRNAATVEWMTGLPALAGTSTVRGNLVATLLQLARMRAEVVPLELSLMADPELAVSHRDVTRQGLQAGPAHSLTRYLEAERDLGRIRTEVDLEQATVVILATLFGIALVPVDDGTPVSEPLVTTAVDLLVTALETAPNQP